MTEISNTAKILSVSDITARVDELHQERTEHDQNNGTTRDEDGALHEVFCDDDGLPVAGTWEDENPEEADELDKLGRLLEELSGRGTSHDWGGNTYPDSLIADHYFTEYTEETAYDMGAVSRDASWIVIDWEATANGMQQDYKQVDFDGETYWYRA